LDKRTAEYKSLSGGYNLYSIEVNKLAKDVYILASSMELALMEFRKDNDMEPISIKKVQEKIGIRGAS